MKLSTVLPYLKKIQKVYKSCDTLLEFCCHQHFFTGNQQILTPSMGFYYVTQGTRYGLEILHQCGKRVKTRIQNVLGVYSNVSRSFRGKTVRGLFTPPTLNMVKINVFWHNGHNAIILYYDVTDKMSSLDSNYIVDVVMLQNSSIFMREVIKTWILQGFGKKRPSFFERYSWFKFNTLRLALDMAPKFWQKR